VVVGGGLQFQAHDQFHTSSVDDWRLKVNYRMGAFLPIPEGRSLLRYRTRRVFGDPPLEERDDAKHPGSDRR